MGLIETLIRRRVLTTVLVLIAVIVGALSYVEMGLRRFPDIEFPFATVTTIYPGGSPSEIESEITKPIEDAVSSISGIYELQSYSQQGQSMVFIQFDLEEDIDIKAMDIRNQLDLIRSDLPDDAEDPFVQKISITQEPVMTLALAGPQGSNELYRLADEDLSTVISQVSGVADVNITGGQPREIQVLLDARKLRALRVPIGAVVGALQASNVAVPAGNVTQPGREYVVRTTGRFKSVDEVARVRVPTRGRGTVTVADLGEVRDAYEDVRSLSRYAGNGELGDGGADRAQDAVLMVVQAESGANEVEVADGVFARMDELRGMLPDGARLEVVSDETEFVRGALSNVRQNMMIGILLTAIVLYLFLHSGRATLVVAVVMPCSVIATFLLMRFSGFTINILTLTGLAICIGVLVNNAILIVDNVTRYIHEGNPVMDSAVEGTKDIAIAIFSSTATNLVVFIPLAFMGEIIGRFFLELGLTVAYATIVSLAVSYSLTPMMCGLLLKPEGARPASLERVGDALFGWIARLWRGAFEWSKGIYLSILDWCLAHPILTIGMTVIMFVASLPIFPLMGMEFQPESDDGWIKVSVQMPVGTPVYETDKTVRLVEQQVAELPHLARYYATVGNVTGGLLAGSSEGVNIGEVLAYVGDRADREESLDELMNLLRSRLAGIPSAQIVVAAGEEGPGTAPVELELSGDDLDQLKELTEEVMAVVESVPSTTGVSKSYQEGQPEVRIEPRLDDLNRHHVDAGHLAGEVRSYIEGSTASQFRDGDENYDIQVMLDDESQAYVDDIPRMFVTSPATGNVLRIGQVADIVEEAGPSLITRKDRRRLITVSAQLTGARPSGKVVEDVRREMADIAIPEGVRVKYGGEAEFMQKNFRELFKAMATAAVLTFLCVAGIIESFLMAAIIIMALPVCLIGVAVALFLGGVTVNMFSLMAMVILVGMVVNNAIIVIDYAARERHSGIEPRQAIRDACERRFRMILMANMTTIVALIPLSLGLGFAGEVFRPLAVVQMGGVGAAAVLSLLVIPCVYVLVRRKTVVPPNADQTASPQG